MTDAKFWIDPDRRDPWCPGPDAFPCPRCGECGRGCIGEFAWGAATPCAAEPLTFDAWALRCLEHGVFVSMFTISGPPHDAANKPRRLALDFGVSEKWWRRGYGNNFDEAVRDAISSGWSVLPTSEKTT